MESITLKVPTISCQHCVNTIRMELGELQGVVNVVPSAETKTVQIEYQEPVTRLQIIDLLTEINYPVEN